MTSPQNPTAEQAMTSRFFSSRPVTRQPGYNVDQVDVDAGLELARQFGYDSAEHQMVAEYALMRHARGEEDGAEKSALSGGIDLTSWHAIRAAAVAAGTLKRYVYRWRGVDGRGNGRVGRSAFEKQSSLGVMVAANYRAGWKWMQVCAGEGPVPPGASEDAVGWIDRGAKPGMRVWWAEEGS